MEITDEQKKEILAVQKRKSELRDDGAYRLEMVAMGMIKNGILSEIAEQLKELNSNIKSFKEVKELNSNIKSFKEVKKEVKEDEEEIKEYEDDEIDPDLLEEDEEEIKPKKEKVKI